MTSTPSAVGCSPSFWLSFGLAATPLRATGRRWSKRRPHVPGNLRLASARKSSKLWHSSDSGLQPGPRVDLTTQLGLPALNARTDVKLPRDCVDIDASDIVTSAWTAGFRAVVSGHSHKPGSVERNGVLYINPGSAGPRRFKLPITVARLDVTREPWAIEFIDLA